MILNLTSTDKQTSESVAIEYPDRYRVLLASGYDSKKLIPRGRGLSYVAASFGKESRSISLTHFNRILDFRIDDMTITVESGLKIGSLLEFLLPFGFTIVGVPGHPNITIGGCIAANTHGKNQAVEGNFAENINSMQVFHPEIGEISLSRDSNKDLFDLTIGGFGMTGIIISAKLKLKVIPRNASVRFNVIKIRDFSHGLDELIERANGSDIIYSWHSIVNSSPLAGPGVLVCGNYEESTNKNIFKDVLDSRQSMPFNIYNKSSISIINKTLYLKMCSKNNSLINYFDSSFPLAGSRYFSLFGKSGFIEHQTLIPFDSFNYYMKVLSKLIQKSKVDITMASMKIFSGQTKLLRFDGNGISLTIDMPTSTKSLRFMESIDVLDCECGAKANIMKDSRINSLIIAKQYPEYLDFIYLINKYNCGKYFSSSLSKRLGI